MFKYESMDKQELFSILTGISTASLIISNILAFKTFTFYGVVLPASVIIYPILYIISDILSEIYGFSKASNVIILGYGMNLLAVILYNIAIMLPAPPYFVGADAFALVLSTSFKILVASFLSYTLGSLTNVYVMSTLKERGGNTLFFRCIVSTIFGETLDSCIFITIVFYGSMPLYALLIMILSQITIKTMYEVILYPITKSVISRIKLLPDSSI